MNIVIQTFGTRGDVQPFVALGRVLRSRGHRVRIATCERFRGFIEAHELDYGYINNDILNFIESDPIKNMIDRDKHGPFQWIRAALSLMPKVRGMQKRMLKEQWESSRDADLLISHPKALGGPHIAEALSIPYVIVPPFPAWVTTREFPLFMFPKLPLGGLYNRLTYKISHFGQVAISSLVNEFREQSLGLPRKGRFTNEWTALRRRGTAVVHPFSRHVVPPPADWPDHVIVSGYWFLDARDGWTPSRELENFLGAGEAPIYIGFGSMVGKDPKRLTGVVLDGVARSGVRAVIASGWGGLTARRVSDRVMVIEQAPHDWLLPRCSAAVHHGGAGSTAAGLRAGLPTLVCPFFVDQPFWGERVHRLGVGPKPLRQKRLESETLAEALTALRQDRAMRSAAESLGEKIRAENGLSVAVEFIGRHVKNEI